MQQLHPRATQNSRVRILHDIAPHASRSCQRSRAQVRGFHEHHPKVAWAHEGLGRLFEKQEDLDAALAAYAKAAAIRRALQAQAESKELFQAELSAIEARRKTIYSRRAESNTDAFGDSALLLEVQKPTPTPTASATGPAAASTDSKSSEVQADHI